MKHNLTANKGETFTLSVRYKDSTGTPVDLTGTTARFDVKSVSTGAIVSSYPATTQADGWIMTKVSDEETAGWNPGKNAHTLVLEHANGDQKWVLWGVLNVNTGWS